MDFPDYKMQLNSMTLRFKDNDSLLESQFREYFTVKNLNHFRFCCVMSIIFLSSWELIDYLFYRSDFFSFLEIKMVVILFFIGGVIFSFVDSFPPFEQSLSSFFVLLVGLSFCLMIYITSSTYIYPLIFGIVFNYIFNYTFIRIRFIYAAFVGFLLFFLIFLLLTFGVYTLDSNQVFALIYFFLILNFLGMIISYTMEYSYRKEFYLLNSLKIEKENEILLIQEKLYQDEMTGLYNRKALDKFLEKKVRQNRMSGIQSYICYIDLDQLKFVNDNMGHKAGDLYIVTMAQFIKKNIRNKDLAFRLGGDEFLIFLNNCESGNVIIDRILNDFTEKTKELFNGFTGSFSYGLVSIVDYHERDFLELISIADKLMFRNKKEKGIVRGAAGPVN
jgi:diguanylate cyclase (GGDEF)-like protein